jgi:hypothetical protein
MTIIGAQEQYYRPSLTSHSFSDRVPVSNLFLLSVASTLGTSAADSKSNPSGVTASGIGVGIGIGVGLSALFIVLFIMVQKRRRRSQNEMGNTDHFPKSPITPMSALEVGNREIYEIGATPQISELPASKS